MPRWGRPPGARLGGQVRRRVTQWEDVDGVRFEEIDSGEDDDDLQEGVRLGSSSLNLRRHANMDKASARAMRLRANGYDYDSDVSDGEDYDLDDDADSTVAYAVQLAMRDKEEWLVERALERIRRAQMLGKKNVRLSQRELDALERKRMQTGSSSKKAGSKRRKSDEPVPKSPSKGDRRSSREHYVQYPLAGDEGARGMARTSSAGYGRQSSSSSSQRPRTPTTQSLRPQPSISPPDLQQSSPHSQRYSTARPMSSSRDFPFPRTLPDDPQWAPPQRPLSNVAPYSLEESPYLQSYGPPLDPRYGVQARRYAAGLGEAYRSVSNESNRSSNTSKPVFPHRAPHESSQEESSSEEDEEEEEVVQVKVKEPSPPRGNRTRAAAAGMGRRRSGR
ncbi:hypothetical protein VTN96DRAFT_2882 [Rasamsonia emersonii]